MKEHDPQLPSTPESAPPEWDRDGIGKALGASDRPTIDAALGKGFGYELAQTRLELYLDAGVMRVSMPELQLTMATPTAPLLGEGEILFQHERPEYDLWCAIGARGQVVFSYTKQVPSAPESSQTSSSPSDRNNVQDEANMPLGGDSEASQRVSAEPLHTAPGGGTKPEGKEQQPRVRITGNIMHTPKFVDPKDQDPQSAKPPYLRFRLEERQGEQSVVHQVFTTKERAVKHRGLAAGNAVTIVGLVQETERTAPDGTTRKDTSIYALGIKRVDGPAG